MLLVLWALNSFGQNSFVSTYGTDQTDDNTWVSLEGDTGQLFVFGMSANSSKVETSDFIVHCLASNGDSLFTKSYRNSGHLSFVKDAVEFEGDFYLLLQMSRLSDWHNFTGILKLDGSGDSLWQISIDSNSGPFTIAQSLLVESTDSFVISGWKQYAPTNMNVYTFCLDSTGNKSWEFEHGGQKIDLANDISRGLNSDYWIVGHTSNFGRERDLYVLNIDSVGNLKWDTAMGGPENDGGESVVVTADGKIFIAGYYQNLYYNSWISCLDTNRELEWDHEFGDFDLFQHDKSFSMVESSDGNLICAGTTSTFKDDLGGSDVWLLKIDKLGNEVWSQKYRYSKYDDDGKSVIELQDGGYLITGHTTESSKGSTEDFLIIKTDSFGCILPGCQNSGVGIEFVQDQIRIFPNPLSGSRINIIHSLASKNIQYELVDLSGTQISSEFINDNQIELPDLSKGFYLIKFWNEETHFTRKLVVH